MIFGVLVVSASKATCYSVFFIFTRLLVIIVKFMSRFLYKKQFCLLIYAALLISIHTAIYAQVKSDSMTVVAKELIRMAQKTEGNSPKTSLYNSKKAVHILEQAGDKSSLILQAYFQMARAYYLVGEIDTSVIWFNKILSFPDPDMRIKAKTLNMLCIDYRRLGDYAKATKFAHDALEAYRSVHDSTGMMEAIINNAKIYHYSGNNKRAMKIYMDALPYAEKTKDTLKAGILYSLIANVYMDIEQVDKGKEYYRKAIQKLKSKDNTYTYADLLNNYGIVFFDEGRYDSALFYYNQALDVYRNIGQTDAIGAGYQNIGITHVLMKNSTIGLDYLHRALDIFNHQELPNDEASVLVDLGRAFIETRQFDSATYYLNRALDISEEIGNTYYKKQSLFLLYQLNEKKNNYISALRFFKEYTAFKDSVDNLTMKENIQELEVKYQTAKHEKEILHLKDRELLDKAQKRLMIVGMVGLILAFGLILIVIQLRRKKDRVIQHQKNLVHLKEKALTKAELERRQAYEKQLETELEFKTRQMVTHTLTMMQKNKLLQDITEDIDRKINSPDCKSREAMTAVKMSLKQGLNVDNDWDLFKLYFEQINESFFDELKKLNPSLTGNDYKLCALIKLNMSVKEMASVLNISPDSLKNARYRLKKKLNLKEEENLNMVISEM